VNHGSDDLYLTKPKRKLIKSKFVPV
jgi:hypothetical protein